MTRRLFSSVLAAVVLGAMALIADTRQASALLASIQISPTTGEVGAPITITGSGFLLFSTGSITFGATSAGSFNADLLGNFSVIVPVPPVAQGLVEVRAASGLLSATASFTVKPPSTVLFGVSTPAGPRNFAETDQFEKDAGKRASLIMYYEGWPYNEFDPKVVSSIAQRGADPVITWEPWDYVYGLNQPEYSLAKIISGTHDPYIKRYAQGAKSYGKTVYIRFAHEMNAKYYPWSEGVNGNNTPGEYIKAWRHVVGLFRAAGATNVKFVWNPNISYAGTIPYNQLYPGDDWVDWVGLDGYNGGTELPWGGFLQFQEVFGPSLAEIRAITTTKPVMIAEVASVEGGGSKPDWIKRQFDEMAKQSDIKAFVWFNHNKEADWRIQSSATSSSNFATGVANPRYVAGTEPPPVVSAGARYNPLTPARILDTREGNGAPAAPIGPGGTLNLQVTGRGGVPASGVSAVVMNVTVTAPSAPGSFLTTFPAGEARPLASNLNFTAGQTVPNLVVVKLGAGGKVSLYNAAGNVDVIADVAGWYDTGASATGSRYNPLTPARILDTREGNGAPAAPIGQGGTLNLQVTGRGGVPASGVSAVVMNVTVTAPSAPGSFLTTFPAGEARPLASNLNFTAGQTVPNLVVVKLGAGGKVSLYNAAGNVDVIADVAGWYDTGASTTGASYNPLTPARILDTREGNGAPAAPIGQGGTLNLQVTGRGGVPASGVSAVVINITVTAPSAPGSFLTTFPAGEARPLASNLNFVAGQTVPNLVVVKLGAGGKVSLYNAAGNVDVIADVAGWYGTG